MTYPLNRWNSIQMSYDVIVTFKSDVMSSLRYLQKVIAVRYTHLLLWIIKYSVGFFNE